MRLIALTRYGDLAASARQRLIQFVPALHGAGIDTQVSPLLSNEYMAALARRERTSLAALAQNYAGRVASLRSIDQFDVVWLQYEALPFVPAALENYLLKRSRRLILDYDDAIFHRYDLHPNPVIRKMLGSKIASLMRRADLIICGNKYLENYTRRHNDATIIIPTVVDADRYKILDRQVNEQPVVGWVGSPSTYKQMRPTLANLVSLHENLGVTFQVIGSGLQDDDLVGVNFLDWREDTEAREIAAMDIGIMPLPDDPWSRGKCGYKLIQYMAAGLPVVASPVGVNGDIVDHGVNGFLANSPEEWAQSIRVLAADPQLRAIMGLAGQRKVMEWYSLEVQAPRFVDAIKSVL